MMLNLEMSAPPKAEAPQQMTNEKVRQSPLCEMQVSGFAAGNGNHGCPDRLENKRLKSLMESESCCLIIYGFISVIT